MTLIEQFKAARRAGCPLIAIHTADPAATMRNINVSMNGNAGPITTALHDEFFGIVSGTRPDRYNWLTPVKVKVEEPVGA